MNWGEFFAQLLAGAILLPIWLWIESWLDERRSRRHDHHQN